MIPDSIRLGIFFFWKQIVSFLVSFQTPAFFSAWAFASGLTTKQEEAIFGYIMLCLNNLDPTINLPNKMEKKKRYWKDRSSALAKT